MQLSLSDLDQLKQNGISPEKLETQLTNFEKGFPFMEIVAPATVGNGIMSINDSARVNSIERYKRYGGARLKFVPASGAATRMFKDLFECLDEIKKGQAIFDDRSLNSAYAFFERIRNFAFYPELAKNLKIKGHQVDALLQQKKYGTILEVLLNKDGMNYGTLPKGLLKFHSYGDTSRTAVEEHLVEGTLYARQSSGSVPIHLTVSPEHIDGFTQKLREVTAFYENKFGVSFRVSFSVQKKSTDTIAVDVDNKPFREPNGKMLFRPGGHGALLDNLNDQDEPLIFIKNIDNVVPDHLKAETVDYKMVIAGLLLEVKELVHSILQKVSNNEFAEAEFMKAQQTLLHRYFIKLPERSAYENSHLWANALVEFLDKPIRVCGMVRNEGEPGGGPFWVVAKDGQQTLQIVESSQIDLKNRNQKEIFSRSTHFNPVDLVCWTHNFENKKFDLEQFSDPETGFIAQKSKDGRILKAQELPGLWNGAMAKWLTLFVEVPLITFNPVKSVNDLLRPEHQPNPHN
ncbi:MAG TPA: DUF4301 family protein [Williamwhitmania sp.]|nr:DUF4301 family protein [Williamwhitmania sp.]